MSEDQDLDRRRLAYRRAGYAVARYTQGRRVPDLSLSGTLSSPPGLPDDRGRRQVDMGSMGRHRLELEILAQWAGFLSESRACLGDAPPPGGWGPAAEPMASLGRRVTRTPEENDAYLEWLRQRALGLIGLPEIAAAVEALASALLAEEHMGSRRASEIVGSVQQAHGLPFGLATLLRRR